MNGDANTPWASPSELHVLPSIFDYAAGGTLSSQQLTEYVAGVAAKIKEKLNDKVAGTAIVNNTIRVRMQYPVSEGWLESYMFEICGVIAGVTEWEFDTIWPHASNSMKWVISYGEDGLPIFIWSDPTSAN